MRVDASTFLLIVLAVILGNLMYRELEARGILIRPSQSPETLSPTAAANSEVQTRRYSNPIDEYLYHKYPATFANR